MRKEIVRFGLITAPLRAAAGTAPKSILSAGITSGVVLNRRSEAKITGRNPRRRDVTPATSSSSRVHRKVMTTVGEQKL